MSGAELGPSAERRTPAQRQDQTDDRFAQTVGALSEGALRFPYPFDLQTSAALAGNNRRSIQAILDFVERHPQVQTQYRIQIHEVALGDDVQAREIVDTTNPSLSQLLHVVLGLLDELPHEQE